MMQNQKEILLELLKQNFFVKSELRVKILEKIENLNDFQIENLIQLLTEANQQQTDLIKKIAERNPDFIKNLNTFTVEQIHEAFQKEEIRENLKEGKLMAELDFEIDNL